MFDVEMQLCWDQQFGAIVQTSPSGVINNTFINVKYQIKTLNLFQVRSTVDKLVANRKIDIN